MRLEQQVTSLELSERLKELGVKQESYFMWCIDDKLSYIGYELRQTPVYTSQKRRHDNFSAFTVAELGELLPNGIAANLKIDRGTALHIGRKRNGQWFCGYSVNEIGTHGTPFFRWLENKQADTEADARSKMLIYLLENKLIYLQN